MTQQQAASFCNMSGSGLPLHPQGEHLQRMKAAIKDGGPVWLNLKKKITGWKTYGKDTASPDCKYQDLVLFLFKILLLLL